MSAGRFAPSPTGELHLGNLRTALVAWLAARATGRSFLVRMEDLDRDRTAVGAADQQLTDLAALGLDWDGEVLFQSTRLAVYADALAYLEAAGLTYPCFCTRREILEAASAPHASDAPEGAYGGTCRTLTSAQRAERAATGRAPALRLRSPLASFTINDALHGDVTGPVDDFVVRRGDGTPAYNLAVVVDDAAQGIDQVVRGDDLLSSAPRQAALATLLGLSVPSYLHVPLALNPQGQRLAKRDVAVTLGALAAHGVTAADVVCLLARSLGLSAEDERVEVRQLLARFDVARLPRTPWVVDPQDLSS